MLARRITMPVLALLLAGLTLLAAGGFIGHEVPWGGTNPRVQDGTAFLHVRGTGLAAFESAGGEQTGFDAQDVWWDDEGSRSGQGGLPPCLKVGTAVPVRAGVIWVNHPGGGGHRQVVWIGCS